MLIIHRNRPFVNFSLIPDDPLIYSPGYSVESDKISIQSKECRVVFLASELEFCLNKIYDHRKLSNHSSHFSVGGSND